MKRLTSFDIKLIAFTLMIVDHSGRFFFSHSMLPVALGRLSFPLFAWLAVIGQRHTSDLRKYLIRLVALGIISQPIYAYVWHLLFSRSAPWNVVFSLAFGVGVISILNKVNSIIIKSVALIGFLIISDWINLEGGSFALITIYLMSKFKEKNTYWYFFFVLIHLIQIFLLGYHAIEFISVFSPLILTQYNGQQGRKARWFYFLYPLHLVILVFFQKLQ